MTPATYSHGHHSSVIEAHAARTVDNSASCLAPLLESGMRILDVGCGPGSITIDLARRVDAGAKLKAWARAAGFTIVETDVETWCSESPRGRALWGQTTTR